MTDHQPPTDSTTSAIDAVAADVEEATGPMGAAPDVDPADLGSEDDATQDDATQDDATQDDATQDGATDGQAGAAPVAEPEDPVAAAERERDEYLDALRRKQAEFENFRKRMAREGAGQRIAGHAEVAGRLLDVLDDFERTLDAAGEVDPGFLKGVTLVQDKLVSVLGDFGLARIDDPGEPFDPNRHEAVQQVEAEQPTADPTVLQVLRPGYELSGRVLRAAMVVVEQ